MERFAKKRNVLLARDDVGRAKDTCVRLPPADFVYGKSEMKDLANVGELTTNWIEKGKSRTVEKRYVDYTKLNKAATQALKSGANNKDALNARVSIDFLTFKASLKQEEKFRVSRAGPRRVGYISGIMQKNMSENTCFGKANRPSTPIQGVISGSYMADEPAPVSK